MSGDSFQPEVLPAENPERGLSRQEEGFGSQLQKGEAKDAPQMAAVARERFEIEGMVATAMRNPRNQLACRKAMLLMAQRPIMAANCEYSFPRGWDQSTGERNYVVGVSVYAAKPLATEWGNIRSGVTIVRWDEEGFQLRCFAHDLEKNRLSVKETSGRWLHQRKNKETRKTEWMKVSDERERREIAGKSGAIGERNALLDILPPDVVEEFTMACRETCVIEEGSKLEKDRKGTTDRLVTEFSRIAVPLDALEKKLGHPMTSLNATELAELRAIYKGIKNEGRSVDEYFTVAERKGATPSASIDLSKARQGVAVDPPGGSTIGDVSKKDAPAAEPEPAKTEKPPLTEAEMRANDEKIDAASKPKLAAEPKKKPSQPDLPEEPGSKG